MSSSRLTPVSTPMRPDEIHRNAEQHDHQPWPCVLRLVEQQYYIDKQRNADINHGQHGISPGAVGTLGVRTLTAQHKQSDDGQDIEDQHGEDDVIEQLAIGS